LPALTASIRFVVDDQRAASGVDDANAVAHLGESFLIQHARRLGGARRVQRK